MALGMTMLLGICRYLSLGGIYIQLSLCISAGTAHTADLVSPSLLVLHILLIL